MLCITETWLTENITDAALFLRSFQIHRTDGFSGKGKSKNGGCLIAVTKNIPSCKIETEFTDCVTIRLLTKPALTVAFIYSAPPNSPCRWTNVPFHKFLLLNKSKQRMYKISNALIMGDIKFTSTDWSSLYSSDPEERTFLDGLSIGNYEQQISEAGRSLDVILNNQQNSDKCTRQIFESCFSSDHQK